MDIFDLEQEEIKALYYRCQGNTPEQARKLINVGISRFFETQKSAFEKLNILGDPKEKFGNFQRQGICDLIGKLTKEDLDNWYDRRDGLRKKLLASEPETPPPETQAKEQRRSPVLFLFYLVLVLASIGVGIVADRYFFPSPVPTPEIIIVTATSSSQVLTDSSLTPQSPLPTPLGLTTPPEPTNTAVPTNTPPPTNTVIPTPETLLIDSFSGQLDPRWHTEDLIGNPVIVDGQLTTDQPTRLSVGDTTWTDYEVQFDFIKGVSCSEQEKKTDALGVRATDESNMLLMVFHECRLNWIYVTNGEWKPVPGTERISGMPKHWRVRVEGSSITVFGTSQIITFTDNNHPNGYVYFYLQPGSIFDNFQIKRLP